MVYILKAASIAAEEAGNKCIKLIKDCVSDSIRKVGVPFFSLCKNVIEQEGAAARHGQNDLLCMQKKPRFDLSQHHLVVGKDSSLKFIYLFI